MQRRWSADKLSGKVTQEKGCQPVRRTEKKSTEKKVASKRVIAEKPTTKTVQARIATVRAGVSRKFVGKRSASEPIDDKKEDEGPSETDSSMTTTASKADDLQAQEWYHGFLPRNEMETLLRKNGDFVVRQTELNHQEKFIISVRFNGQIKHFVINKTKENHYYVERKLFESVSDLIRYYVASRE